MMQSNPPFDIVYHPEDWVSHDNEHQVSALQHLAASSDMAEVRELENAAERFRPSDSLLTSINAALAARVPLLLTGEPGTGKTQVAWFLKRFFKVELFEYQVRSNSQAADMRYDFDAVAYLRDAYLAKEESPISTSKHPHPNPSPSKGEGLKMQTVNTDPRSQAKYLKHGPLWQAYEHEGECVLLIDEIDKAPRDFPNDLLQELDQHKFSHPFEPKHSVERKGAPPIIIITSNGERRLPDAFLRRCIVHHIALDRALLAQIMAAWEQQFPRLDEVTRKQALKRFEEIRGISRLSKRPGAAELLLWLSVLSAQNVDEAAVAETVKLADLPALVCLIKDHADYKYLD